MVYKTHMTIEEWENSRYDTEGDDEKYISGEWLKYTSGGITYTVIEIDFTIDLAGLNKTEKKDLETEIEFVMDTAGRMWKHYDKENRVTEIYIRATDEEFKQIQKIAENYKVKIK